MESLRLISSAGSDLDLQTSENNVLTKALRWTDRIFKPLACSVILFDGETNRLKMVGSRGYPEQGRNNVECGTDEGLIGRAFSSGSAVLVRDISMDAGYRHVVDGTHCEMVVPLMVRGKPIGVLNIDGDETAEYGQIELEMATLFASNVAGAIHSARTIERSEMRARDLTALNEIGTRIATFTDLGSVLKGAMGLAKKTLFFRSCALLLKEEDRLVVRAVYGFGNGIKPGHELEKGVGASWRCYDSGVPVLVCDVEHDVDYVAGIEGARCAMLAPLFGPDGVVGVISAESPKINAFNETSLELFSTFAHQVAVAIENARLHETARNTYYETIRALAHALEMRDSYTHGHSERVARFAKRIARKLELEPLQMEVLEQAALLHDIGKIGIRDSVLHKNGQLNGREREDIERHPVIGDNILHPVGFLNDALLAVLHHHEHFDGSGYPSGLAGEDIPLVARIIAVADTFDAMTSNRPYRKALSKEVAINEIVRQSGTQFDPVVVEAFIETIGKMRSATEELACIA